MKVFHSFVACVLLTFSLLSGTEFTICSYNCGGLSEHYDYLRAAAMEKLMQDRHIAEPRLMALNEKIQKVALKRLFAPDSPGKAAAQREWKLKNYKKRFEFVTQTPALEKSPNRVWNHRAEEMITSYKVRPVVISDAKVNQILDQHLGDLSKQGLSRQESLQQARAIMAKRIFANHLNYDILCLQEADYLDVSMFPDMYEVEFLAEGKHNIIAWNKQRFERVYAWKDILGKACMMKLRDKETGKVVLVASGHFTGCNPYRVEKNPTTDTSDSAKGDHELQTVVDLMGGQEADLKVIGMDSNVTALHPRLRIIKKAGYEVDYENYLESTCTNPHQILNTRIDWICLKSDIDRAVIMNIPVLSVGLNNITTNISDHKPIAAKVRY